MRKQKKQEDDLLLKATLLLCKRIDQLTKEVGDIKLILQQLSQQSSIQELD